MKIGIKAFDDWPFIESLQSKADFVEIMAIEGRDYSFFKNIKIPVIIHMMHNRFGINLSDPTKEEKNISALKFATALADKTNAKKIIVHPGPLENSNCEMDIAERFLKKINDKRVILENHSDYRRLFPKLSFIEPNEVASFLRKTNKEFCLDINHAISYAIAEKVDYLSFLKEFLKLNPIHFHLGGQKFNPYQEHLDFSDSDINLNEIFKILPSDAEVTLEVSKEVDKTAKDIDLIRNILGR